MLIVPFLMKRAPVDNSLHNRDLYCEICCTLLLLTALLIEGIAGDERREESRTSPGLQEEGGG